MRRKRNDVRVQYHGVEFKVVLGPPYFVEQPNGALMGSGMPTINLADPNTGELRRGLTVEIPEAPLKPGQVLVGGKAEGLRALTEAGVVRLTGNYYRSEKFMATFAVCDLLIDPPCERNSVLGYPLDDQKLSLVDIRRQAAEGQGQQQAKERPRDPGIDMDR